MLIKTSLPNRNTVRFSVGTRRAVSVSTFSTIHHLMNFLRYSCFIGTDNRRYRLFCWFRELFKLFVFGHGTPCPYEKTYVWKNLYQQMHMIWHHNIFHNLNIAFSTQLIRNNNLMICDFSPQVIAHFLFTYCSKETLPRIGTNCNKICTNA